MLPFYSFIQFQSYQTIKKMAKINLQRRQNILFNKFYSIFKNLEVNNLLDLSFVLILKYLFDK